ncbi:MAG: hypothetical protein ACTSWN_14880 [Promethearchaeota archaeon]
MSVALNGDLEPTTVVMEDGVYAFLKDVDRTMYDGHCAFLKSIDCDILLDKKSVEDR